MHTGILSNTNNLLAILNKYQFVGQPIEKAFLSFHNTEYSIYYKWISAVSKILIQNSNSLKCYVPDLWKLRAFSEAIYIIPKTSPKIMLFLMQGFFCQFYGMYSKFINYMEFPESGFQKQEFHKEERCPNLRRQILRRIAF